MKALPNASVIEYSLANMRILADSMGEDVLKRVRYLPMIPTPNWHVPPNNSRPIDLCHVGYMSDRRRAFLTKCSQGAREIKEISTYGESKIAEFSHCKILLNVHFHDAYAIAETQRMMPALAAGCVVLTEASMPPLQHGLRELVVNIKDMESCPEQVQDILDNYAHHRNRWFDFGWEKMSQRSIGNVQRALFAPSGFIESNFPFNLT